MGLLENSEIARVRVVDRAIQEIDRVGTGHLWIDSRAITADRRLNVAPRAAIHVENRPQADAGLDRSRYRVHF